jgi:hypothetical protein
MWPRLMAAAVYPLVYWPLGIALGGWLFFQIARRM